MVRKTILCALGSGVLISAGAAFAQHGPGGMHGPPAGMPTGNMGNMGNMGTGNAGIGISTRDDARINSQALDNASATGIAHANSNSVLGGTSGTSSLTGLTAGMAVMKNGAQIGTVERVVTNNHGVIVRVFVRGSSGQLFSLSPARLNLSGTTLTTTAMLRTH